MRSTIRHHIVPSASWTTRMMTHQCYNHSSANNMGTEEPGRLESKHSATDRQPPPSTALFRPPARFVWRRRSRHAPGPAQNLLYLSTFESKHLCHQQRPPPALRVPHHPSASMSSIFSRAAPRAFNAALTATALQRPMAVSRGARLAAPALRRALATPAGEQPRIRLGTTGMSSARPVILLLLPPSLRSKHLTDAPL